MRYTQMMEILSGLIPDGVNCSLPIIGIRENKLVDILFTYVLTRTGELSHPRTVYIITADRSSVLSEQPATCYDDILVARAPLDFETAISMREKYIDLYDRVYDIAYKSELTQESVEIVREFMMIFEVLVEPAYKPVYRKISPEFFEWVSNVV
jgi:hypothetical protein